MGIAADWRWEGMAGALREPSGQTATQDGPKEPEAPKGPLVDPITKVVQVLEEPGVQL